MKITNEIRERIVALAIEHIAASLRGQPSVAEIAAAIGLSDTSVCAVLRESEQRGAIGRRCAYAWSNGDICGQPLTGTTAVGHLSRTVCGLHRERGGVRSVERSAVERISAVNGDAPPNEAPQVEPVAEAPSVALAPLTFDGTALEVVEVDGKKWVPLRSAFAPFGREVEKQIDRLKGWLRWDVANESKGEDLRKVPLRPLGGLVNSAGKRLPPPQPVWAVRAGLLASVIVDLDTRGMPDDLAPKHARWKRDLGAVVNDYLTKGVAVNPRLAATVVSSELQAAIEAAVRGAMAPVMELLAAQRRRPTTALAPTSQVVIRLDGATRREPDPSLATLGEVRRFCAVEGFDVSEERIRRIGLALGIVGDDAYGAERDFTDCSRVIKVGWGTNHLGVRRIVDQVKRWKEHGGSFDDFLPAVPRVGVGTWTGWQSTRPKARHAS